MRRILSKGGGPGELDRGPGAATQKQGRDGAQPKPGFNDNESPLAWLARRKSRGGEALVSPGQLAAGERLREEFWRAQLHQRVTTDWSQALCGGGRRSGGPGAGVEVSDGALAARERVNAALSTVGPELSGILIDVCCHLKGLEAAERDRGWPQRSAKVVLLLALTRLARHYGFETEGTTRKIGPAAVRHWAQGDYRPEA